MMGLHEVNSKWKPESNDGFPNSKQVEFPYDNLLQDVICEYDIICREVEHPELQHGFTRWVALP